MIDNNITPPVLLANADLATGNSNTSFLTRSSFRLAIPAAIRSMTSSFDKNESAGSSLGNSFQPGKYDVICGRGKGCYNRPGNKRFREIVIQHIPEYQSMRTKLDKSIVLNKIVEQVQQQNDGNAHFVKKDKKKGWFKIGDDQAREKVGHAMREAISATKKKDAEPTDAMKKDAELKARHQMELMTQQRQFFTELLELSGQDISSKTSLAPI